MGLARRISNLFRRSQIDSEISAELEAHMAFRTAENIAAGMTLEEARRDARLRFGNPAAMKEQTAGADAALNLDSFWHDLRYAVRQLRRSPGFAFTAIITLAVAIGANAIVFSVMNVLVLKPLNLPGARSLYMLEQRGYPMNSYPDYLDIRQRTRAFEDIALYNFDAAGFDTGGDSRQVWVYEATGNYFHLLGVQPYLGRFFQSTDEHGLDTVPYLVLSYDFWRTQFHSDPTAVGRTVQLNRHTFTILGVAPPEFRGTEFMYSPDLWVPMTDTPLIDGESRLQDRGNRSLWMIGRLKPQVTIAQATSDLNAIAEELKNIYPKNDDGLVYSLAQPGLAGDMLGGPVRAFVTGLMLLACLILLAACANLGSLFSARAADRAREIAMRIALGSTRGRILRQILTEALLIALAGGTLGIVGSTALLRALSAWRPLPDFPVHIPVNPDASTYIVAILLALLSGLLCGLAPIRQIFGTAPWEVVKTGVASTRAKRLPGLRDVLLIVQIAVCAILMTSSLVAVRGLERTVHSSFGFQPDHALLMSTELRMAGYDGDRAAAMQRRMLDTAAAIPGVQSAALIDNIPLGFGWSDTSVFADGTTDLRRSNAAAEPMQYAVSPGYFQTAGTTLLAGRDITWQDDKNTPSVAVVNREFARKLFGSVSKAIGGHFIHGTDRGTRVEVIGVVEDGKYISLTEETKPAFFVPLQQAPDTATSMVLRTSGDPQSEAPVLREAIHDLDNGLPFTVTTWNQSLISALFGARAAAVALGVLGLLGAILAITGIFGMASYSVSKRLKEMGIRMALGADQMQVLRSALGRAFRLLAFGSLAGLLLGVAATHVLSFIVYQATPLDPVVLAGTILVMLLVGLIATWAPAQRALHVRPARLLREE
jgi:predicted permease